MDDSTSDAFSRMLQTFRFSMATVHIAAKKTIVLFELEGHSARDPAFKENVITDAGLLNRYRTTTSG